MAQEFNAEELEELLKPEALTDREAVPTERVEDLIKFHLERIEEESRLIRQLIGLYAFKIADRFNRNRIDYIKDEANATHILPYVRVHETSHHAEMVWGKMKNWMETDVRSHAKRVKQKRTKNGRGTLNSTVVELTKYRLENGDFSLRMFDKEPMWVQIIGKDVELNLRPLRLARSLLTEIMRKERSVKCGLGKVSERFKPEEG